MVDEVRNNMDKIIEACKRFQVEYLYLVGSAVRQKDFTHGSDIDFLYSMIPDDEGLPKGDIFDLIFALEKITNKKVDLIYEKGIRNKYFLKSVNEDKVKIYEA